MYAIVEIKGQQFKAEEGKYLYVHHLGDEVKDCIIYTSPSPRDV
ncbi:MAG: bL21 family ribosomal protein, partial [Muribaculaceae bacterium]|nr:bL21 family ribosomal protein [Muribaculaceae bacterium]